VGTFHLAVSVFFSNMEDSVPPEVEDDYLPFSWSDSKWARLVYSEKIFDFELELLTSFWQALLGILCSAMVHNCSATHYGGRTMSLTARLCSHLLGQAQDDVAQRIQGARGLAMGGTTPDTHDRLHGLRSQGWSNPQGEDLRCTTLLSVHRKASRAIS